MSMTSKHYTCKDCRRWGRIGESSWGRCDVDIHLGNEDTFADDLHCPAFDDGSFEKAVRELIEALDKFMFVDPDETVHLGSVSHRIMNLERILRERESRKGEGEK